MTLFSDPTLEEYYYFGKFAEATVYLESGYTIDSAPFLFIRNYLFNTDFENFLSLYEQLATSLDNDLEIALLKYYRYYYLYLTGNFKQFNEEYPTLLTDIFNSNLKDKISKELLFEIKILEIQAFYKTGKLKISLEKLDQFEKELSNENKKELFIIENLRGNIYHELGNIKLAEKSHKKTYNYYKSIHNEYKLANSLNNLARILQVQGKLHESSIYFEKASKLHEKFHHTVNLILSLNNLAILYYNQGKINQSIEIGKRTLKLTKNFKDPFGVGYSNFLLGLNYLALGNYDQADSFFSVSLENWLKTDNPFLICSCIYYIVKLNVRLNKNIMYDESPLIYYPRNPFPTKVAKLIFDLIQAEILYSESKFNDATEILENVLKQEGLELGFQIQAHENLISNYYELYLASNDSNLLNKVLKRIDNWESFCKKQHLIPSLCKIHILRAQVYISLLQINQAELELKECINLAESNYLPYQKNFAKFELQRIENLVKHINKSNSSSKLNGNLDKDMFLPYLREIEKLFQKESDN